ncbi:MAG: transglycosylase SLT domain-containing protein, partial [Acidobacteria bacterium]|nr:transglycosylase SLT domain-containing protein [Acidobacteriota bacterium]
LEKFAEQYSEDQNGVLAYLVLGYEAFQARRDADAKRYFQAASKSDSAVRDYAEYYLALSEKDNHRTVAELLNGFASRYPWSPLAAQAILRRARSLLELGRFEEVITLLLSPEAEVPQPDADMLLAETYLKNRQLAKATEYYRRVYYQHPISSRADVAERQLNLLKKRMGTAYPSATAEMRQARAERLFDARQWQKARSEYQLLGAMVEGKERDHALLRVGVSQFQARETWPALSTLLKLAVSEPELDAERLYTLAALYRRLGREKNLLEQLRLLEQKYPQSPWYERGLFLTANYYLTSEDPEQADRYYRLVYLRFPQGEDAVISHWKVAWYAYRQRRQTEAKQLFEEHLRNYPESPQASAALYWLGRLMEKESPVAAAACYRKLVETFPNYYYGLQARERLAALPSGIVPASAPASLPFASIHRPGSVANSETDVAARWQKNLTRVRLLEGAWLIDLAITEIQELLAQDSSATTLGPMLARLEQERGRSHVALRYAKRYVGSYFARDLPELSRSVWETLFPLPWWEEIKKSATATELDPYLVAGLIRQESEFNPAARSRSNARGLMQLLPSTARLVARSVPDRQARQYQLTKLYRPEVNLIYGTNYLKQLVARFEGNLAYALAGYNAGPHRVVQWLAEGEFEEPAEFVESIPFTETREYVQAVLRGAAMYRQLYPDNSSSF